MEIAKKQLKVDRLNRQLADSAKQNGDGEENAGPLENTKKGIQKQISEIDDEITQAQKAWIANQKALIDEQGT